MWNIWFHKYTNYSIPQAFNSAPFIYMAAGLEFRNEKGKLGQFVLEYYNVFKGIKACMQATKASLNLSLCLNLSIWFLHKKFIHIAFTRYRIEIVWRYLLRWNGILGGVVWTQNPVLFRPALFSAQPPLSQNSNLNVVVNTKFQKK